MGTAEFMKNQAEGKNPWFGIYRNEQIATLIGSEAKTFQDSGFILIVTAGQISLNIDGIKYIVEKDGLFTVYPSVSVSVIEKSEDFKAVLFDINSNMVNYFSVGAGIRAYVQVAQCPLVKVNDEERDNLLETIDFIERRSRRNMPYYSSQMFSNLIRAFCYEVASVVRLNLNIEDINGSRKNQIFQKFIKEVMTYYSTEHRVEFYANRLGLSAKYLCMVVKEVTNIPPQNWINDVIIRSAKVMLSTTDMSINEITRQLNFPNPSFFCQYFKRSVGQTPLKYRKMYK